jgi:hypothetical protein
VEAELFGILGLGHLFKRSLLVLTIFDFACPKLQHNIS